MEPHWYEVTVQWNRERQGVICSPELTGDLGKNGCIEVATPPQFPKGISGIWSPEHLFTASVAGCLMTTFLAIAENSNLDFSSFKCKGRGKLEKTDNGFRMTEVILEPVVTVQEEWEIHRALKVLAKSETNCLITNSVQSKVTMKPKVLLTEEGAPVET